MKNFGVIIYMLGIIIIGFGVLIPWFKGIIISHFGVILPWLKASRFGVTYPWYKGVIYPSLKGIMTTGIAASILIAALAAPPTCDGIIYPCRSKPACDGILYPCKA